MSLLSLLLFLYHCIFVQMRCIHSNESRRRKHCHWVLFVRINQTLRQIQPKMVKRVAGHSMCHLAIWNSYHDLLERHYHWSYCIFRCWKSKWQLWKICLWLVNIIAKLIFQRHCSFFAVTHNFCYFIVITFMFYFCNYY